MKIPVKYSIRSLLVRRVGTSMTAMGIGLTVAVVVVMLAMVHGLDMTFIESGDPLNLVVVRKGAQNEVNSYFDLTMFDTIRFLEGVQRDADNVPIATGEILVVVNLNRKDGSESNVSIRGIGDKSVELRPALKVIEGRLPQDGLRELMVSDALRDRFSGLELDTELDLNQSPWKIVGIFDSGDGANESEIWGGYQDIAQVWQRPVYSSILLRTESATASETLQKRIADDRRIQLDAINQKEYFENQTVSSIALKALSVFIAIIMGIGSCFAIMNMMYGAVMSRQQEVATLRALGFRRRSILASFLLESAFLGILGGIVGCLLGSLFNGYSAGTSNFASFSEVVFNFRVTPTILLQGMLFATFMGVLGGFLPARRAASVRLIDVLRG
ncbi:MAG: ABC transporter permease [Acidobacteriota bacterium]|nr:MAG: ABC transporter permease [Acidobacteriota bacterium]